MVKLRVFLIYDTATFFILHSSGNWGKEMTFAHLSYIILILVTRRLVDCLQRMHPPPLSSPSLKFYCMDAISDFFDNVNLSDINIRSPDFQNTSTPIQPQPSLTCQPALTFVYLPTSLVARSSVCPSDGSSSIQPVQPSVRSPLHQAFLILNKYESFSSK